MLTSTELISFIEANPGVPETDLVRAAGYVRTTKNGKTQLLKKAFIAAVFEAKGLKVGVERVRERGKSASYVTTVHRNGIVLLGRTYAEIAGFEPGDALQITVREGVLQVAFLDETDEHLKSALEQAVPERQLVAA